MKGIKHSGHPSLIKLIKCNYQQLMLGESSRQLHLKTPKRLEAGSEVKSSDNF